MTTTANAQLLILQMIARYAMVLSDLPDEMVHLLIRIMQQVQRLAKHTLDASQIIPLSSRHPNRP